MATAAVDWGISAFLRAAILLPVVMGIALVLVPPSWSSQQASVWPQQEAAAWPREGSRVEYELQTAFSAPDGSYQQETTATLALVYDGAAWSGSCSWTTTEVVDGVAVPAEGSSPSQGKPAAAPTDARSGETVVVDLLGDLGIAEACRQRGETVLVLGEESGSLKAQEMPETSAYQEVSVTWDQETGLVLDWSRLVHGGSAVGRLVASDALR